MKQPETITKPSETTVQEVDTSVLRKINASAKEDSEPKIKASPRKFEINIEVESCDDDDDEFASIRVENRLTPAEVVPSTETLTKPIALTRDLILEAADNIVETSTEVADKILNIYLRNTIGDEQKEKLETHLYETKIQKALDDWRTWQFRSFHREDPLFYKCYICTRSWWFLSDFRTHLSSAHPNDKKVKIILEKYGMHEANIIAYHDRLVVIKDIYAEGLCHRCGKDYAAHELSGRHQEKYYMNEGCSKQFFSCMGLRDHLSSCPVCKVDNKPFNCVICQSRFDTVEELSEHLVRTHSVRSDIPMVAHYSTCKKCSEKYSCRCWQKGPDSECRHCFRTFPNAMALELHTECSKDPYKCQVCSAVMLYSCQKYEHMLSHTDRYMAVRKCVKCEGLNVFLNIDDARAHLQSTHEVGEAVQKAHFPTVSINNSSVYYFNKSFILL